MGNGEGMRIACGDGTGMGLETGWKDGENEVDLQRSDRVGIRDGNEDGKEVEGRMKTR